MLTDEEIRQNEDVSDFNMDTGLLELSNANKENDKSAMESRKLYEETIER